MELLQVVALMSALWTVVEGIQCWHCIAEDCAADPSANYKATKKACKSGQSCQKVYFEMLDVTDNGNFIHTSTVRSCSSECKSRDDFINCTELQRNSRGCIRKDCCSDTDLCNSSNDVKLDVPYVLIVLACVIVQT
ncbi:uncharacterized protein LOC128234907 [Mya arenaria]|nr:uncharacterized protein LOC128234907 [Mya arenaria]XP_052805495.1 uncharacterized protein LOC128234907 [Mya arenaria]